jgi:hypothetical protein
MTVYSTPEPFLQVTVESHVYTRDAEEIGVVKEIRGRALKIRAGLFRQFWVRADAVAAAVPDISVVLVANKDQLDDYKVKEPPAAA